MLVDDRIHFVLRIPFLNKIKFKPNNDENGSDYELCTASEVLLYFPISTVHIVRCRLGRSSRCRFCLTISFDKNQGLGYFSTDSGVRWVGGGRGLKEGVVSFLPAKTGWT